MSIGLLRSAAAAFSIALLSASSWAQTAPPPGEETPSVKVGGMIFTDFTYTASPATADTDGNAIHPSAFNVTRVYVNVTGRVGPLLSFRITPDIRANLNDPATDRSLAGSNVFQLKFAFLQLGLDDVLTRGSFMRLGLQQTPFIEFVEGIYRYRFQGPILADREGYLPPADYGLSIRMEFPDDWGDFHFGVYNGETFRRFETNDQKALEARVALRPFPKHAVLKGLRVAGFSLLDHYVTGAKRNRTMAGLYFEHPRVRAGAEALTAADQNASAGRPVVKAQGYSAWVTPITRVGIEGLFRYDSLRPDKAFSGRKHRAIAGVSYWFKTFKGAQTALLWDFEAVSYESGLPPALARPDERRVALHALLSF